MLTEVRKNIGLIVTYFKFNLSSSMEYRTSFLIQTFGMLLNNSTFIFFWWILFDNIEQIGGYGFKEVMLLWAISSSSYGLSLILFGNIRRLSHMIVSGEIDPYLLQPKNVLVNVISSNTVVAAWGDLFYGIILFLIVYGFNPGMLALFLLACLTGCLLISSILIIANSLTFYIGNAEGIAGIYTEFIISFSIYPEGIFKGFTRLIIYTLLPAGFISFIPARIIQSFSWQWSAVLLIVVLAWVFLAFYIFKRGLKRYESGNLIVSKL